MVQSKDKTILFIHKLYEYSTVEILIIIDGRDRRVNQERVDLKQNK